MKAWRRVAVAAAVFALAGCGGETPSGEAEPAVEGASDKADAKDKPEKVAINKDPFPSTYAPGAAETIVFTNANVFDGIGGELNGATVVLADGKIAALGADVAIPDAAKVIDAAGRWVTPGVIDIHSHLGVYPSPSVAAHQDGNEISAPVTAEVWAEHGVWPQDPGFDTARAGGVTTLQILPGSANLFGGRGVTVRNVSSRTVQGMKFPGAPYTLKMACGENPKRVYGYGRGAIPSGAPFSRMGNVAGYREAWAKAAEYKRAWTAYEAKIDKGETADPPKRDLELDTLMGVLDGEILVQMHCYRADEMALILDMAEEFGYKIAAFHHAVEAYKIADLLAEHGACAAMWADWWGFKMEAYDGVRENIPLVHAAGACATVHSDSDYDVQRLNQEIAKALSDGRRAGLDITKAQAWAWLSANPAKALGIFDQTGSLEPGKRADVVLWSSDPFSTYARADQVFIDGVRVYDRNDPSKQAVSDFVLGQTAAEATP